MIEGIILNSQVWTQKVKSSLTRGVVDLIWQTFFHESRCLQYIDIFIGTNTKMNYASYHFLGEMSLSHVWTFVPDDLQNG